MIWALVALAVLATITAVSLVLVLNSPGHIQRVKEREIERKKQQDIAELNDAYKAAVSQMNDAAGQTWRNITSW